MVFIAVLLSSFLDAKVFPMLVSITKSLNKVLELKVFLNDIDKLLLSLYSYDLPFSRNSFLVIIT